MCCQASLIVTPLVLSTIYTYNWEAAFYFSGGVIAVAALVMLYMSCRDDRQLLGKKGMVPEQKVDIEMQSKEKKAESGSGDNAGSPVVVVPSGDAPASAEVVQDGQSSDVQLSESAQITQSPEPAQITQSPEPAQITQSSPTQPTTLVPSL